jgi:hypothetical protein
LNISEVEGVVGESRRSTLAGELAATDEFVAARGIAAAFKFPTARNAIAACLEAQVDASSSAANINNTDIIRVNISKSETGRTIAIDQTVSAARHVLRADCVAGPRIPAMFI